MSKQKKIEKEFVLTDSSVNCYGFRLLTEGYLIDEYKKNAIGYAMHNRHDGVLVRWEDLRVDGDAVYAKPVINLSHPMGQRTVDEIENGFLNAASVGHIVVLETSEEVSLKLDGQTGPTVTKWYNRECSLVDVPGNYNALIKLFDVDENEINLTDFTKPKIENKMKKIEFTAAHLAAMKLNAEADDLAVSKAFDDLVAKAAKADGLQTQLDSLSAQAATDKINGILDGALAAKKITVELKAKLAVDYAKNPEGLKNLVDALPEHQPVSKHIGETGDANEKRVADLMAKPFDELMETGLSAELQKLSPEKWKEKCKAEGVELK